MSLHPPAKPKKLGPFVQVSSVFGAHPPQGHPVKVVPKSVPNTAILIEPGDVVARDKVQPYPQLPGILGLRELLESGAIIGSRTTRYRDVVANYAEQFSARYRSRFDPGFYFSSPVDYVVTRAVTLPPDLPRSTFMVASGAPAPDMNGNRDYAACFYFEDDASRAFPALEPRGPRCRRYNWGMGKKGEQILYAAVLFDEMEFVSNCRQASLPSGTHIALVALSEGINRRFRNDPPREIRIDVTRDGPVMLYLTMEGGPINWTITGPDIVDVFMSRGPEFGMYNVTLNGKPFAFKRLGVDRDGCPGFAPQQPNRLGPQIALLDKMLEVLLGQTIDQVIVHIAEPPLPEVEHYVVR